MKWSCFYTILLKSFILVVMFLFDVNNWLAPVFVTVEPAGIIAVWMRWDKADDGAGMTAIRRCDDGDSFRLIGCKVSLAEVGCFLGVNWRSFIERRSSPFVESETSGQWTCCFRGELTRVEFCGVFCSETNLRWSFMDSAYGPLYDLDW